MSELEKKKIETDEFREILMKKKGYMSKMKRTIQFLSWTKRDVEGTREVKKCVGNLAEKLGAVCKEQTEKKPLTPEEELAFKRSLFEETKQAIMNGSNKRGHKEINTKNLCNIGNLEALIMDGDFVLSNFENFRKSIQNVDPLILLAQQVITNGDQCKINSKKKIAPCDQPNRKDLSLRAISKMMTKVENTQTPTQNPISGIFNRTPVNRNNSSDTVSLRAPIKLNNFEKIDLCRRDTTHSEYMADFSPKPRRKSIQVTAASSKNHFNLIKRSITSKFQPVVHPKAQNPKNPSQHGKIFLAQAFTDFSQ